MIKKLKNKYEKVYAFIDSQNLNLGTSKDFRNRSGKTLYRGWRLDMKKFNKYLKDKFRVSKAYLFIGYIESNKEMYKHFENFGYELIYKPTVKDHNGKHKGNIDAEIVLHAARLKYDDYDKAVFVSGDGDFYCLYEFLASQQKLKAIIIPNKFVESSLLKNFEVYKHYLYRERVKLELKK